MVQLVGHPSIGEKLGRFRLDAVLGKGGAGTVYRATDEELDEVVCVKLLHPALANHPEMIGRFKRELVLARRVAAPGLCRLFDLHDVEGIRFLTMEFVDGQVLREMLRGNKRIPVPEALVIIQGLAAALAVAHEAGIVHRDLKPQNIIVRPNGQPVILDFGVATALDVPGLTRPGVPLGTRHYIAPEVWRGEPATHLADLFALGIILYNCLTARMPFSFKGVDDPLHALTVQQPVPLSTLVPHVPPQVEQIFEALLARDPAHRIQSAAKVDRLLAAISPSTSSDTEVFPVQDVTIPELPLPFAHTAKKQEAADSAEPLADEVTLPASNPTSFDDGIAAPIFEKPPTPEFDRKATDNFEEKSWIVDGKAGMSLAAMTDPGIPVSPAVQAVTIEAVAEATNSSGGSSGARRLVLILMLALGCGGLLGALVLGFAGAEEPVVTSAGDLADGTDTPLVDTPAAMGDDAGGAVADDRPAAAAATAAGPDSGGQPVATVPNDSGAPDNGVADNAAAQIADAPKAADAGAAKQLVAVTEQASPVKQPRRTRRTRRTASSRTAAVSPEKKRYEAAMKSLTSARRAKGLRIADLPMLAVLQKQTKKAARGKRFSEAADRADEARRMVAATRVDDAFIRAKLARFNRRYDKETDPKRRDQAGTLMGQVLQASSAGQYAKANSTLNRAFDLLR